MSASSLASPSSALKNRSALAHRRLRCGLHGFQVARLVGLTPQLYSRLECGVRPASPGEVAAIEAVLRIYERAASRAQRAATRAMEAAQ